MIKLACNDCLKPIAQDENHLAIPELHIIEKKQHGIARGLHFCDDKCMNSWVIKSAHVKHVIGTAQ